MKEILNNKKIELEEKLEQAQIQFKNDVKEAQAQYNKIIEDAQKQAEKVLNDILSVKEPEYEANKTKYNAQLELINELIQEVEEKE